MFDCVIIGGGIAGLQASIQLGRYQHKVLVLDANRGRSTLCRSYHNVLGWPGGVSGLHLRSLGRTQAMGLGIDFQNALVQDIQQTARGFSIQTRPPTNEPSTDEPSVDTELCDTPTQTFLARTLLIATGVVDNLPPIPGLDAALGLSVYVCPDCDGYECSGRKTVVIGAGDTGADMAVTLLHWTKDITYVNHGGCEITPAKVSQMEASGIRCISAEVEHLECDTGSMIHTVVLANGQTVQAERGFVAFAGNRVESSLAASIGVLRKDKKHILVNPRTKMTSVQHVWAAGDVVAHSEQVSIAMGDGSQAAIFIHKALLGASVPAFTPDVAVELDCD